MPGTVASAGLRRAIVLLAVLPWPLLLFQFLLVVPRYDKLFRDFGVKATTIMAFFFDVSAWTRSYSLVAFLLTSLLALLSVGFAQVVQSKPLTRRRRWIMLGLIFGLPCGLFALSWLGVWSMHRTLVETLQN